MSQEFTTVAKVNDLAPGEMKLVRIRRKRIGLYNVDGEFFATDDTCTHEEASLTEGELYGDIVECPLHGGAFNVRSGDVESFPPLVPVQTYDVRIEGEDVQVANEPKPGD